MKSRLLSALLITAITAPNFAFGSDDSVSCYFLHRHQEISITKQDGAKIKGYEVMYFDKSVRGDRNYALVHSTSRKVARQLKDFANNSHSGASICVRGEFSEELYDAEPATWPTINLINVSEIVQ